ENSAPGKVPGIRFPSIAGLPRLGGHVRKVFLALMAAAAGVSAQTIQLPDSLYAAGDTISWVKKIPTFCEGPVWEPSTGYVYFTRQQLGASTWPIIRIKPGADTGIVWV